MTSESLPADLAGLVEKAKTFLERHDEVYQRLTATHENIPSLLADRRKAAVTDPRRIAAIDASLAVSRGMRELAAAQLSGEGPELSKLRAALDEAIQKQGEVLTRAWREEYQAALRKVQELEARGRAISTVLRIIPEAELFGPALRAAAGGDAVDMATLYPAIEQLRAVKERLNAAASLLNGIAMDREHSSRFRARLRNGDVPPLAAELFTVTRQFDCLADGLAFLPGALVDASLMGVGVLRRLSVARLIEPTGPLSVEIST